MSGEKRDAPTTGGFVHISQPVAAVLERCARPMKEGTGKEGGDK